MEIKFENLLKKGNRGIHFGLIAMYNDDDESVFIALGLLIFAVTIEIK